VKFTVQGIPKAQPRPRACIRGGRASVYDPGTAKSWRDAIYLAAIEESGRDVLHGPLSLSIWFQMPRPKSHYRKSGLNPEAPRLHSIRPDIDNLLKAVMDALNEARVWQDDDQVAQVYATKEYADIPGSEGAIIEVEPL